jgi:hypothetical protein
MFCAEHQIEIAKTDVEIDDYDILPRLSPARPPERP